MTILNNRKCSFTILNGVLHLFVLWKRQIATSWGVGVGVGNHLSSLTPSERQTINTTDGGLFMFYGA